MSKIPDERQLRRELRIVVFHMLQQEKAEAEKARLFAASDPPAASAAVPSLESDAAAAAASAVSDVSTAAADVASAAVAQVFSPGYKWPGRASFCAAGDFRAQLCTRTLMPCQLDKGGFPRKVLWIYYVYTGVCCLHCSAPPANLCVLPFAPRSQSSSNDLVTTSACPDSERR